MTASENTTEDTEGLADRIAAEILAHPAVAHLHGGPFGLVSTHLPGRQVRGIRAPEGGPVEVAVVLRLDRPMHEVADELRARVRSVVGEVPVDITISDVVLERQT